MKKLLFALGLLMLHLTCNAQTISLETYSTEYVAGKKSVFEDDIEEVKDINNSLDKFVGNWNYTSDTGTLYEFRITKDFQDHDFFKKEGLSIRYKITDSSGNIIENTFNISGNTDSLIIHGDYFLNNTYVLLYGGRKSFCGQFGQIFITLTTPDQNTLDVDFDPEVYVDRKRCPTGYVGQILPENGVSFIRQ